MMVHEIDEDDDGEPETLRLGFATSKRWLENDATILVKNAPTNFGLVSFRIQSIISKGIIKAQVEIPSRNRIKKIMFRVRVPDGNQIKTVKIDGKDLFFDQEGTINLSQYSGIVEIEYAVQKN